MKEHLAAASAVLFVATLATGIYFAPIPTLAGVTLLFLYTAIYAEIKEAKQKKNGEDTRTTEGNI